MKEKTIYMVSTNGWTESLKTEWFAYTLPDTIGIIRRHLEWMYSDHYEVKDFSFGEECCGTLEVKYKLRTPWLEEWEEESYMVWIVNHINKLT